MRVNSFFKMMVVTSVIGMVSGCSLLPVTHQEKIQQHQTQCNQANLLLSDLSKPVAERTYSFKPGVGCDYPLPSVKEVQVLPKPPQVEQPKPLVPKAHEAAVYILPIMSFEKGIYA